MGWMQKGDNDILTLQIKCSGPIKGLTVTADARAHVKGYADNPVVMLPPNKDGKLDVGKALDMGVMSVIKDIGMKEPYVGQTHLVSEKSQKIDLLFCHIRTGQFQCGPWCTHGKG